MLELLWREIVKSGVQGWWVDLVEKLLELINVQDRVAIPLRDV